MQLEIISESYIYRNPMPAARSRQATFPGVTRLPSGELLAIFVIGEAFEAANCRPYKARSCDNGRSWTFEGPLYDPAASTLPATFSDSYKPTLLNDGSLLAFGYGFDRDDPERSLSDYIERDGELLPATNTLTRSSDGGHTWTPPEAVDFGLPRGLETSGPALALADGTVLVLGPMFSTKPDMQAGLCFATSDGGRSWQRRGNFFDRHGITAWETRAVAMGPKRVATILWAFDLTAEKHLCNYLCLSDDAGKTWSAPIATGIMAQSSNLCHLGDDRLLSIHSHRGDGDTGLFVRLLEVGKDSVKILGCEPLMTNRKLANAAGSIDAQFASLKLGQPSLLHLGGDEFLASYWCCDDGMYVVKSLLLKITGLPQ